MTTGMRAHAAVVAEWAGGRTRLTTLRSDPPVALWPAAGALYLAASAGGPVGGDVVDLALTVRAGAALEVRSVGATLALPGPAPAPSVAAVTASVAAGAELRWRVEPSVLARGSDHRTDTRVDRAAGASLVWREEAVLGRSGEVGGSVLQRLRVDRAGRPLLRTEHAAGPRWPGSTGPAGTGGHRALGTAVVVGPAARLVAAAAVPDSAGGGAVTARAELAADAVMVIALAPTALALHRALDRALVAVLTPAGPVASRGG